MNQAAEKTRENYDVFIDINMNNHIQSIVVRVKADDEDRAKQKALEHASYNLAPDYISSCLSADDWVCQDDADMSYRIADIVELQEVDLQVVIHNVTKTKKILVPKNIEHERLDLHYYSAA